MRHPPASIANIDVMIARAMLTCGRPFAAPKPSQSSKSSLPAPGVDVADALPEDIEAVPEGDESSKPASSHSSSSSSVVPPLPSPALVPVPVPLVAVGSAAPGETTPVGDRASGDNALGEIASGETVGTALVMIDVMVSPPSVTTSVTVTSLETVGASAVTVAPSAVTVLVILSPLTTVVTT